MMFEKGLIVYGWGLIVTFIFLFVSSINYTNFPHMLVV